MSEHYKITFFTTTSPNTPQNRSNNSRFFKKSCLRSTQNSTTTTLLKETALKLFTIQKKNSPFTAQTLPSSYRRTIYTQPIHPQLGAGYTFPKVGQPSKLVPDSPTEQTQKSRCFCIGFYIRGTSYLLYVAPFRSLRDYMALTFF